jgi:hypothetical protein
MTDPNSVIVGRLTAIEPGYIVLGQDVHRIAVPTGLSVADFRIGARLAVMVHRQGDSLIAASIAVG